MTKYEEGYTEEEVKQYLFDKFLEWMNGQTIGVINNEKVYWKNDVERYRK